jgi:hypothetical protein
MFVQTLWKRGIFLEAGELDIQPGDQSEVRKNLEACASSSSRGRMFDLEAWLY